MTWRKEGRVRREENIEGEECGGGGHGKLAVVCTVVLC